MRSGTRSIFKRAGGVNVQRIQSNIEKLAEAIFRSPFHKTEKIDYGKNRIHGNQKILSVYFVVHQNIPVISTVRINHLNVKSSLA